ncbi:MAG: thiolase family protein [Sporomusaceae bacterium]|nr:thiolase family protein [Sporomusaceae bacterium]
MQEVVVVAAIRTPIGSIGGSLKSVQPEVLAKAVIEGVIEKSGLDKALLDEVIIGQTKQTTDAPNIARVAALMAGVPEEIPAYTVHRQCASGLQALVNGWQQIQTGYSGRILAGGVESMSTAPFYIRNARFGVGSGNAVFLDPNIESQPKSQPQDIYGVFNMIQTAETVASQFAVSRQEQDEFALASQQKAVAAIDANRFAAELIPLVLPQKKGEPVVFAVDEYPKRTTSREKLAQLKPIFPAGTVTAGNASGRNDGACALVLMSRCKAAEHGIKPLAKIIGAAAAGVDPRIMGIGPVPATQKLLKKLNMRIDDFGLVEINEAFAAQAVACARELRIDQNRLNVNGGAIALGHPLGCSGARIATTLLHEMRRRGERYGLASICIAGGLGMAIAFENID